MRLTISWFTYLPPIYCLWWSICSNISLIKKKWIVSMSWLLWIVLLWTQGCVYLFKLEFSPDICPGVGLLDSMVTLFLVFWGTSMLFSVEAAPICIPTSNVGGFPILCILSSICPLTDLVVQFYWWWIHSVFYVRKKAFISSLFFKYIFSEYRIWGW